MSAFAKISLHDKNISTSVKIDAYGEADSGVYKSCETWRRRFEIKLRNLLNHFFALRSD